MSEDSYEQTEEYKKEYEKLLAKLKRRAELAEFLKFAKREQIPAVRAAIAGIDKYIEQTEVILEIQKNKFLAEKEVEEADEKVLAMAEVILPELRKHLAETDPEKLEIFDAIMSDDGRSH
jgi:hypothetical protein